MTKTTLSALASSLPARLCACALALVAFALVACSGPSAHAETLRKRYNFPYDRTTRRASSMKAASLARKKLLQDFLAAKFSPDIINNLAEDIDVALDPPDERFLTTFNVVSERLNEDESQVTLTVEGEFDFASMVSALVQNKVLSFGKEPPRVMVLPSTRFENSKAAKTLRALMYDQIKQAGLRPVAFESAGESVSFRVKGTVTPTSVERQAMIRTAVQYGADYLIYIDTEAEAQPLGPGYIADATFIHTILRPNGSVILGESVVSERGSGSSAMLAFDRALDSVAPVIARVAIGQLYESIYSDSDVIYDTPQLKQEKTLVVNFANAALVQALVARLQQAGVTARLGTGMSDVSSRVIIETTMDDLELYEWLNRQSFNVAGKAYKTPVVAYAENRLEVEAVAELAKPKQPPLAKAPPRRPRPAAPRPAGPRPSTNTLPDTPAALAKVVLRMRPARFN